MSKWRVLCLSVMLTAAATAAYADHIPIAPTGVIPELETVGRVILRVGDFNPMLDITTRFDGTDFSFGYRALTVGSYYRLLDNLKIGLFYRLQAGVRHNDDWIDLNPGWKWVDSTSRYEHVAMLDVSPRFQLDFLPGRNWVFMLKTRYEYNFFNNNQSIYLRPGLSYFLMKDREPVLVATLQYAAYLALNFGSYGTLPVYEHGPYLEVLYNITNDLQIAAGANYLTTIWTESADFIAGFGSNPGYDYIYRALRFNVGLIFRPVIK